MEHDDHTIQSILDRNKRVEAEKAWEVSKTRRAAIALITYLIACLLLWWLGSDQFFLQSLVPVAGYLLSTLSLPWIKRRWIRRYTTNGDT